MGIELNDRVKIVGSKLEFRGRTCHVVGLLYGDHYNPTIHYCSECELEKLMR